MNSAKQDVETLLRNLPDDVTVEDIQCHLYVLDKVRRSLEDARVNGTLSQKQLEIRFSRWLAKPDGLGESGAADPAKIARILKRVGKGNPPVEGDELPPEFETKKKLWPGNSPMR
jgi:hypothetical protein